MERGRERMMVGGWIGHGKEWDLQCQFIPAISYHPSLAKSACTDSSLKWPIVVAGAYQCAREIGANIQLPREDIQQLKFPCELQQIPWQLSLYLYTAVSLYENLERVFTFKGQNSGFQTVNCGSVGSCRNFVGLQNPHDKHAALYNNWDCSPLGELLSVAQ